MKENLWRYSVLIGLLGLWAVLLCGCVNRTEQESPFMDVTGQGTSGGTELPSATPTLTKGLIPTETLTLTEVPMLTNTPVPTGMPTPTSMPTPTNTPIPTGAPTPVITDPYDGRFWTGKYAEDTEVLMTKAQIQEQNERNYAVSGTKLVKVDEVTEYSVAEVAAMIESYSLPSRKYLDNREITAADKEALLQARNLSALWSSVSGRVIPEYGILVENTDLRSFPTDKRLTSEVQGRFDYLQETRLLITEPVLVLHRSVDEAWCFVQAENYCGWIKDAAIAYCTNAELCAVATAMADVQGERVAVVTKNGSYRIGDREIYLRMGTRLLSADTEGTVSLRLPRRNADGVLAWEEAEMSSVDTDGDTCIVTGYLSYTRANVMQLAVRLLGAPYAWGDAPSFGADVTEVGDNGMDCSSTVAAVLKCFGFVLPRNTGTQRKMDCEKLELSGMGNEARREVLDGLQGGELLYTSGHVMLYLGKVDGEYYVLHNTSTESRDDGGKDEFYRCVITTMGLGKTGQTIQERLIQMNALFPID